MKEKTVRAGVFGLWRGAAHIRAMQYVEGVRVAAVCEKDPKKREAALKLCPPGVKVCGSFEELLDAGIDLVVLCNYLPDHAACAVRALRKGIRVVSECLAAVTMKECVELVEAVEETGLYYSMAENSPYGTSYLEIGRLFRSGVLGDVVYADAEYCHPLAPDKVTAVRPTKDHWRVFLPKTYYLTHPLGSLMNITRLMPKRVAAMAAKDAAYAAARDFESADSAGILLLEMENGAVFRVTGSTNYAPFGSSLRLACTKGNAETLRHRKEEVSLTFNPWDVPAEMAAVGNHISYVPPGDADAAEAAAKGLPTGGHMIADYRAVKNYISEILEERPPDMNVYRSAAMSAAAILGWRSVLDGSRPYDIPDFTDPAARDRYRNDDQSPWRGEIPYCKYPAGQA